MKPVVLHNDSLSICLFSSGKCILDKVAKTLSFYDLSGSCYLTINTKPIESFESTVLQLEKGYYDFLGAIQDIAIALNKVVKKGDYDA